MESCCTNETNIMSHVSYTQIKKSLFNFKEFTIWWKIQINQKFNKRQFKKVRDLICSHIKKYRLRHPGLLLVFTITKKPGSF